MSEYINTYSLKWNNINISPMKRDEFYEEQHRVVLETGGPDKAVDVVYILLFNTDREIYIQKRSSEKWHNPSLLDKTIWGHVRVWDTPDHTVMLETVQELQVPSLVIDHNENYDKNYLILRGYLNTIALVKHIDSSIEIFTRVLPDGTETKHANRYHLYFGIYDGSTRTVDKEAKGVLRYKLDELYTEIEKVPNLFTQDLRFLLEYYEKHIRNFVKEIK